MGDMDVMSYVAEDIQFSVDFEVPMEATGDVYQKSHHESIGQIAKLITDAGHDTKDFLFAVLPLPALYGNGMRRYLHAARRHT